jgi:glycosyltransferase involved in cell wall biosynthesis
MTRITVGIHVHAEPHRLIETLHALDSALPAGAQIVLLPDGPDAQTRRALASTARLRSLPQWGTSADHGTATCLNRLADRADADVLMLLESGSRPASDALDLLLAELTKPDVGLAGPATNRGWIHQNLMPRAGGSPERLAVAARELRERFGNSRQLIAPPSSLADFCLAVRADTAAAIGRAAERARPAWTWEADYAARAANAGFASVFVATAFVYRAPFTRRRRIDEASRVRTGERDVTSNAPSRPAVLSRPTPSTVSCVMLSSRRTERVAQSIRTLLRQEHESWELIIVDDQGRPDLNKLLTGMNDPRIRHVRIPNATSVGRRRNIGCENARGDLIAHWSDDDWHGPRQLSAQVAPILDGRATATALRFAVWLDIESWRFWLPSATTHRRMFAADVDGSTLLFDRAVWDRGCRYADSSDGVDSGYLRSAMRSGARVSAMSATGLFAHVRESTDSRGGLDRRTIGAGWREVREPPELSDAREFYAAWSNVEIPPAPRPRDEPLVSCIMPTANRRPFVSAALKCFLDQTYAARELVVIDDGHDAVGDLIPEDPRIRYIRLPHPVVLGTKRNIAVEESRGELIVHLDDDDWSHPDRLVRQAAALTSDAEVCGLDELLWWDPARRRAWRFRYRGRRRWVAGNTLAYRREAWERAPFRPQSIGEDTAFVWSPVRPSVVPLHDESLVVGTIHRRNTSRKDTTQAAWSEVGLDEVSAITGISLDSIRRRPILGDERARPG